MSSKKSRNFTVYLTISIFVFTVAVPIVYVHADNWTEDIRLTYSNGRSVAPAIAVEGKNVHIVYMDNETRDEFHMLPWYVRSIDGGNTWSTPICLNNSPKTDSHSPRIAVNGDNIHVIWFDYSDGKIHYLKSIDNGNTWDSEKSISGPVYYKNSGWDIGVYNNNLHVVYTNVDRKLSYTSSNDNGIIWSSPKILIPTINQIIRLAISVEGSNIHVTVSANVIKMGIPIVNIFYTRSTDNGVNWDSKVNINEVTGIDVSSYSPDIASSGNNIHVIFCGDSNRTGRVYYAYSNDNGINWKNGGMLSNNTRSYVTYPTIDVKEIVIFIIWTDKVVHYRYSPDGGDSWTEDTQMTNSSGSNPDLAISEDAVHFTWDGQGEGNWEIYYKRHSLLPPVINAVVDIDPNTLNLKSRGRWITAYIELPEGYDVNDINISTILLQNIIPAEDRPSEVGDHDKDGIPDLMVKFNRSRIEYILHPGKIVLTLTGVLLNGSSLNGNYTIRIISPP